jgi:hypothetical protein
VLHEKRITFRLPAELAAQVDIATSAIRQSSRDLRKFSLNDWLIEAAEEKLSRGGGKRVAPAAPVDSRSVTEGRVEEMNGEGVQPSRRVSPRAGSNPAPAKLQDRSEIMKAMRERNAPKG